MSESNILGEIDEVFAELETLLKNAEVGAALAERGVNISLAMVAADGLHAYLKGDKQRAAEEFDTVTEEIRSRLEASREFARRKPS